MDGLPVCLPASRVCQSVHRSADRESILCLISFETESRQQAASVGQNGYWPQLLDAMMQVRACMPPPSPAPL